jgi:virginiamycin B lyase
MTMKRANAALAAILLVAGCATAATTPSPAAVVVPTLPGQSTVPTMTAPAATSATVAPGSTSPSPVPTTTPSPLPDEKDVATVPGAVSMPTASQGYWLTLAGKYAWVANEGKGLARYDLTSGALVGTTALAEDFCQGMQAGFDSLWVSNCTTPRVLRISLLNGHIAARISISSGLKDEASLAATDNGVWALTKAGTIIHIDPKTNAIVGAILAPPGAAALRGGFGSLWITSAAGDVFRVDPATGSLTATAHAASGAGFLAVGLGSVWVLNGNTATVSRIDPATNATVADIQVGSGPVDGGDIAIGDGFVWARISDTLVAQIDPASNRTIARFGPPSGSGSVGADTGALWISIENQTRLWRVPLH